MTFEIDPDLWLFIRLIRGRGPMTIVNVAAAVAAGAIAIMARPWLAQWREWSTLTHAFGMDPVAVFLALPLLVVPAVMLVRLGDLEQRELLDLIRLAGRTPGRVVAALVGTVACIGAIPLAGLVAYSLAYRDASAALRGGFLLLLAVNLTLIVYGAVPAARTGKSWFFAQLVKAYAVLVVGPLVFYVLPQRDWWVRARFGDAQAIEATAGLAALLPMAFWLAVRRFGRRATRVARTREPWIRRAIASAVPVFGPPEMVRILRRFAASIIVATLVIGVMITGIAALFGTGQLPLGIAPLLVVVMGALATEAAIVQEARSGTLDFVRLTPQSPLAIVAGWYGGLALPFGALAAAAVLVLQFVARFGVVNPPVTPWFVVGGAFLLPAIAVLDALQNTPGLYVVVYPVMAFLALLGSLSDPYPAAPYGLSTLIPIASVVPTLAVAAAYASRDGGTAPAHRATTAMLVAIGACAWALLPPVFPRVAICWCAIAAASLAGNRDWSAGASARFAVAAVATFLSVMAFARLTGLTGAESLTTAVCALIALAIGWLGHTLSITTSVRAPLVVTLAVLVPPWQILQRAVGASQVRAPLTPVFPPVPEWPDVTLLAVALIGLAVAHYVARKKLSPVA